ncbi:maleate cis-trans isomerase [Nocardia sp. CNY236]|uniref:maleate cis-trans isomerase family protein n=1 Tax=Nocardia sp. CNY236 TaxID=1169152 RepID=UPI000562E201|nr:maleate cis-trans isomerase [Nocardia sp. CNY236]
MREPTVGIIYPDHAAEDDYPLAAAALGVHLPVAHIYGTDLHAVPELLDLGSPDKLRGGVTQLATHRPDAVVWACTSGSFVYGPTGLREQARTLATAAGVPATSTSLAFADAVHTLGLHTVAVAASYPDEVAELFVEFLTDADIDVVSMSSAGIDTAAEVGTLAPRDVVHLAVDNDHPRAQALLVPDTAMHTMGVLTELEATLGKPVLTANQVSIWAGLRLAGAAPVASGFGTLFAERQTDAGR